MNHQYATKLFENAKQYCEQTHAAELNWANSIDANTFKNLKTKQFLYEYCWVIYASGFKVATIENKFPELKKAFKDFELDSVAKMRSIKPVLEIFNNERKANSFLTGCKDIANEGFINFKNRLKSEGVDSLEKLPGIGPITKYHLAKNIGLIDKAKPDIWLERAADLCATTVDNLVSFLSTEYGVSQHTVDVILWRYGADKNFQH